MPPAIHKCTKCREYNKKCSLSAQALLPADGERQEPCEECVRNGRVCSGGVLPQTPSKKKGKRVHREETDGEDESRIEKSIDEQLREGRSRLSTARATLHYIQQTKTEQHQHSDVKQCLESHVTQLQEQLGTELSHLGALVDQALTQGQLDAAELTYNCVIEVLEEQRPMLEHHLDDWRCKLTNFYQRTGQCIRILPTLCYNRGSDRESCPPETLSLAKTQELVEAAEHLRTNIATTLRSLNKSNDASCVSLELGSPVLHLLLDYGALPTLHEDIFTNHQSQRNILRNTILHSVIARQADKLVIDRLIRRLPVDEFLLKDSWDRNSLHLAFQIGSEPAAEGILDRMSTELPQLRRQLVISRYEGGEDNGECLIRMAATLGFPSVILEKAKAARQVNEEPMLWSSTALQHPVLDHAGLLGTNHVDLFSTSPLSRPRTETSMSSQTQLQRSRPSVLSNAGSHSSLDWAPQTVEQRDFAQSPPVGVRAPDFTADPSAPMADYNFQVDDSTWDPFR